MAPVNTLPPSKLRPYRIPAFVLSFVVLICVGVAMVMTIRNFTRSIDLVEHSYRVISTAEAIRSSVRSVESSARGYRLSDRDPLLMEYQTALPAVREATSRLLASTRDDPDQQARALELETRVEERMAELQRLIDMQLNLGMAETRREGLNSSGFGQMQQIDALIGTLLSHEQHLLLTRRQTMSTLATVTTVGVVAGILLPLALLGLLLGGLTRENRRSRRLERGTRNALRELAVSLEQRSRLSEQRRVLGAYAGILQSCEGLDEALNVTAGVLAQMLPDTGGRCYVLRSSLNQVEAVSGFGTETVPSELVWTPSACWGIRRGQTHRSGHGPGNVYCSHLHIADLPPDGWTLCVPLMAQGVSLGLLHVNGATGGGVEDVQAVEAIAEQLSLAMINLQLRESLRVQSLRDPLTGLYNRRYLEDNARRELKRCQRRELPLSVIMLDVDHFKRFNDDHGHAAGDALLTAIAQTLQAHTRDEDIVCRYGGEEFTVVMPEASAEIARRRGEEIRSAIAATTVVHLRKILGPITASLGVATFPADGSTPAELIELADKALYRAKAEGRNRLVVHHSATG
ncbi:MULTISPECIES: diguanylate cyclase [unclassified Lysobacter]